MMIDSRNENRSTFDKASQDVNIYSLFSRTSDVAEAVNGKVKFRAAANDRRANLLVVAVPLELHPQDIRKCSPLKQERKKMNAVSFVNLKSILGFVSSVLTGPLKLWL